MRLDLNTWAKWLLNIAVAYHLLTIVALIWTGGYEIELFGKTWSSNRIDPLARGLLISGALRVAMQIGWLNSVFVSISALIALAGAELCVRVLSPTLAEPALVQIHRPSDRYGFELVPGASGTGNLGEYISINDFGARDGPFRDRNELRDRIRIVAIGDSFTFGYGLPLRHGYVKQLEARLLGDGHDVEVLNLGVSSYNLWHYLQALKLRIPVLQPDLVIIGFFLDDLSAPVPPDPMEATNPFAVRVEDRFTRSKLWNLARNLWARIEVKYRYQRGHSYLRGIQERKEYIGGKDPDHIYYRLQTGELGKGLLNSFHTAVAELKAWSTATSIPVYTVFIPDASQLHEPGRQHANTIVAEAFEQANLPFFDTTPVFEQDPDPKHLFMFPLDAHTSPAGHGLIASSILHDPQFAEFLDKVSQQP